MEMEAPEPSIASVSGIPALFSINIQNSQSPACFDIGGRSGSEFNILRDDTVGISVSAKAALDKDDQVLKIIEFHFTNFKFLALL